MIGGRAALSRHDGVVRDGTFADDRCRPGRLAVPAHGRPSAPAPRPRRRLLAPDAVFAVLCVVLGGARFALLAAGGAPPGLDAGNWLSIGNGLFGDAAGAAPAAYPPLVPVVVAAAVALAGPVPGVALVAALASLAPAAGVYAVLRGNAPRWPAVGLAALVIPVAATGEATAWGGYPQLLATGIGPVALLLLDRHLRHPSRRRALTAGAALAAVLATSHFVGLVVLLAAAVLLVLHRRIGRRHLGEPPAAGRRHLALVALPSLPLAPLYVELASSMHQGFSSRPFGSRVTSATLLADVEFVYRAAPLLWRPLVALAVLTPLLAGALRRRPLWALTTSLVVALAVALLGTAETRSLYLLPVAAVVSAGFWLDAWFSGASRPSRTVTMVFAAVLVGSLSVATVRGFDLFSDQRSYYQVLRPGVVDGIDWLRGHTAPADAVAVASVNGAPLGWWVEGLGRRPVLSGSALQWLYLQDERERARTANRIFGPSFPDRAAMDVARAAHVEYLLVARTADVYRHDRVAAFRRSDASSFVFENDDVVILAVGSRPPSARSAQ